MKKEAIGKNKRLFINLKLDNNPKKSNNMKKNYKTHQQGWPYKQMN